MKVIVATCFESNEERAGFVSEACKSRGYDVEVLTSDFSHIRKKKRDSFPDGFIALNTRPYNKNLSIQRMASHARFAKDLFAEIEKRNPDLIWLMAPANSLIKEAKAYKKKHPKTKLIIDIIDMWPESLPISINKNLLPFKIWKNRRKNNIDCCDLLVTECDLYQDILKDEYNGKMETIRWARDNRAMKSDLVLPDDRLSLVYIGSINNIIDVDRIAKIISDIDMPVLLHVIGEGEGTEHFLSTVKKVCEVDYHGPVRDQKKKKEIFDQCHAGINIYKEGLYIGLTVKCIDYFQHGLPIINNIKGDTWDLVNRYHAGINMAGDTCIKGKSLIQMRKENQNILNLYNENLTKEIFIRRCLKAIDEVK